MLHFLCAQSSRVFLGVGSRVDCSKWLSQVDPNENRPPITIPEDYFRIPNGGKVEMRCQVYASNGNQISLDWKRNDHHPLPEGSTVHNGVLTIPAVEKSAAGEYVCLGMDQAGTVLFRAKSHLEVLCKETLRLE